MELLGYLEKVNRYSKSLIEGHSVFSCSKESINVTFLPLPFINFKSIFSAHRVIGMLRNGLGSKLEA